MVCLVVNQSPTVFTRSSGEQMQHACSSWFVEEQSLGSGRLNASAPGQCRGFIRQINERMRNGSAAFSRKRSSRYLAIFSPHCTPFRSGPNRQNCPAFDSPISALAQKLVEVKFAPVPFCGRCLTTLSDCVLKHVHPEVSIYQR